MESSVLVVLMRLTAAAAAGVVLSSKVQARLFIVVMVVILHGTVDVKVLVVMSMVLSSLVVLSSVSSILVAVVQVQRKDHVIATRALEMMSVLSIHQLLDNLLGVDVLHDGMGSNEGHKGQDHKEGALHCCKG